MRRIYFLLRRKLRRPFLSESYGHTSHTHTHTHTWTASLRYQLWLWPEHMFAQRERERESQQSNVKETNRTHTHTLSLCFFLPLTLRAADSLKVLLASSCVCVCMYICVGCLINRPQAFPICLYCIIAWGRFIYFINTAKQLTSFSLSLEFICVAWQVCRVDRGREWVGGGGVWGGHTILGCTVREFMPNCALMQQQLPGMARHGKCLG